MAPPVSVALIWPLPDATLTPAGKTPKPWHLKPQFPHCYIGQRLERTMLILVKGKSFAIKILLFPRCLDVCLVLWVMQGSWGTGHSEAHIGDRQHGGGEGHKVKHWNTVLMKVASDLGSQADR